MQHFQCINVLPDIDGNPSFNCNFNHLHRNMVRLNNGSNSNEKDDHCNIIPNGDRFSEDGEGNHECHNLRQNIEANSDKDNIAVSRLPDTPTVAQIDINEFSALGASISQSEWPMTRALWMSGPSSIGEVDSLSGLVGDDTESIMSFSSSTAISSSRHSHPHQLGAKVEMVYSLLSMLGSNNREDMSKTLLEMSNNRESCVAMRQSGCLPLLVQLLHGTDHDYLLSEQDPNSLRWALREARRRAGQALHNIVYAHPDDKRGRREARVLRLLEQIRDYSDYLKDVGTGAAENTDLHPGPAIAALMKLSFDEEHRHAMCLLGGLQAIAELIQTDHEIHGNTNDQFCITVRRYAGMALTNLTFGDGTNKALLCSMKSFMLALVAQLHSPNEDLRQVTASVLRNLSWRADAASKQILREVDAVVTLMKTAMGTTKESTLKSILSALWNLSAHCSVNKADICAIEGALEFLVSTLIYKSASKTLSIVENGGGILRNISSHIAVREDYRAVLRKYNCLQTLLRHLKSPSLTVVSNACGTLWNLSARCQQDQQALWEMGAVGMLRNLIHSKHKMISMGSAAALKNLLAARPPGMGLGLAGYMENGHYQNGGSQSGSPSLIVRKQRALETDIDQNLSETCDNIDSPKTSPNPSTNKVFTFENNSINKPQYLSYLPGRMYHSINGHVTSPLYVPRSESRDSLGSTRSDPPHYKPHCERFRIFVNTNRHLPTDLRNVQEHPSEWKEKVNLEPEDNTNIVMQLFQSLHSNSGLVEQTKTNNLTSIHQETWDGSTREASSIQNRNISLQNGFACSSDSYQTSSHPHIYKKVSLNNESFSLKVSSEHGISNEVQGSRSLELSQQHLDVNAFCSFSDNKHPAVKSQLSQSTPLQNGHIGSSEAIYNKSHNDATKNSFTSVEMRSQRHLMDPIHENVVFHKRTKCDISHWSSTSTLKEPDSEETSVEHTPLAISRCSSLSSLASEMPPSARNSWISDVSSRRTSAVLSPNALPDSPCDTKVHMFQFTDKAPDAEILGIPCPKPERPSSGSSVMSIDSLLSSNQGFASETEISSKVSKSQQIGKRRSHIMSICENKNERKTGKSPERPPSTPEKDLYLSSSSSSFENEVASSKQRELFTYSNLGMPNNTNSSSQHNNNSKLHSRVNNLSSSFSYIRSGIPVKSNNVCLTQSVPNVSRSNVLSSCAVGPVPEVKANSADIPVQIPLSTSHSTQMDAVCDDNDNLLYRNVDEKQESIDLQSDYSSKGYKDLSQHSTELSDQSIECRKNYSPATYSFTYKAKTEKHPNFENEIPANVDRDQANSIQIPSADEVNTSFHSASLHDKARNSRKAKTSIPQIVRLWHPGFDNEVHPKQLQIMSQNLPIYKGTFAVHHSNDEKINECENREDDATLADNVRRQSDPSSVSADSEVSSAELLLNERTAEKSLRVKAKRNKLFRRSTEIPTPDHSSDEDNQNNISDGLNIFDRIPSLQYNEEEEKGKEDERAKEKYKELLMNNCAIPDLLEGATFHADIAAKKGIECRTMSIKVSESPKVMTDSMELRKGAFMVAAELEELADDHTHSSASCFSDLDNIKPPSVMGEMSMTSSGLSDLLSNGNGNGKCYLNGKAAVDRRRSLKRIKKVNGSQRFVFKSVLQAQRDVSRAVEPSTFVDSVENLSMKSSGTSELLDNINPPSVMDDISMTNSCTSLNSINSDILESRSLSLADPRSDSEMFQRLNAAAAMVQVYSRELSNIMTGSMKSSCNSDNLDQVKPPSVFQDIAEVTVEDGTEVGSDAMISDSELEEELPHDDEGSLPTVDTVHSPLHLINRVEKNEDCSENLNSSFEGDSICTTEKTHQSVKRISKLAMSPQSSNIIDSNSIQPTPCDSIGNISNNVQDISVNMDDVGENLSSKEQLCSSSQGRRGPRIVKPINRETIRQMQEKRASEKLVRSVRGRVSQPSKSQLRNNTRTNGSLKGVNARKSTVVSTVRPTRTSALRASQSQKQADHKSTGGRVSPRAFLSKPPVPRCNTRSTHCVSSTIGGGQKNSSDNMNDKCHTTDSDKPLPPIKQGTFTKDEPIQKVPEIYSTNQCPQNSCSSYQESHLPSESSFQTANVIESSGSDSQISHKSGMNHSSGNKVAMKKPLLNDVSSVKKSSSNYGLRRNVSLPLQKKDNSKTSLKLSPSSNSFGDGQENGKCSGGANSRNGTVNRNSSLSSIGSSLKRTSSQKEVASKISSIWKKSESSSSANSPVTDSSVTERISVTLGKTKIEKAPSKTSPPTNKFSSAVVPSHGSSLYGCGLERTEKSKSEALSTNVKSFQKSSSSNAQANASLNKQFNLSSGRRKIILTKGSSQMKQFSNTGNYNSFCSTSKNFASQDMQHTTTTLLQKNVTKPFSAVTSQQSINYVESDVTSSCSKAPDTQKEISDRHKILDLSEAKDDDSENSEPNAETGQHPI